MGLPVPFRRRSALGLAALLLAAPLAGCGSGQSASAATAGSGRCPSRWLAAELPDGSAVELLVAAGPTIPAGRWPAYRAMADAVGTCAGSGTEVALRPITDRAWTELPLFSGTVPEATGQNAVNPLRYHAELGGFVKRQSAAVDRLPTVGRDAVGSDPLGSLAAAGQSLRLRTTDSKHVVIAVFNGWQQTKTLNLFSYQRDPAVSTAAAVRSLRASGALPDLAGSEVVIVGLTAGAVPMQTSDAQLAGLCRFWRGVVEAGGGTLKLCAPALPGIGDRG